MAMRKRLSRGGSRGLYRATADKTHRRNFSRNRPMRGGTRL
jgi:hypothetical protein